MPADIEELLEQAASRPRRPLDMDSLRARRRRRHGRRRIVGGGVALALVALVVVTVPRLTQPQVVFAPGPQTSGAADASPGAADEAPVPEPARDGDEVKETDVPAPASQGADRGGVAAADPVALVGLWAVRDAGDDSESVLRLDVDDHRGLALFGRCAVLFGAWNADGQGLFVAATGMGTRVEQRSGCVGSHAPPKWLLTAVSHRPQGKGHVLLDDRGAAVARLAPTDPPEVPASVSGDFARRPVVTQEVRRALAPSAPLPGGLTPATAESLRGRSWQPVDAPAQSRAHMRFKQDWTWSGSDGCNDLGGRWRSGADGALLATGGPTTLIGCENLSVQQHLTDATRAGFDGDALVLVDRRGNVTARFRPV